MPDELKEIYDSKAENYERLVAREDYQGNILPAIQRIRAMDGLDVLDLGAGTGRLVCMLAPLAHSIRAFDVSPQMLAVAERKLKASGLTNWQVQVADHDALPVEPASADVVVSGWSLVYAAIWAEGDWRAHLKDTLAGIERTLRPGGTIIILETMGTGFESPNPPAALADYFAYLKEDGFQFDWIRTDYCFPTLEEAKELSSFFFGDEIVQKIQGTDPAYLPECTGIWWKTV
jgi:ubiquinone/menaquinone biosynthesis C-methylase UbiE